MATPQATSKGLRLREETKKVGDETFTRCIICGGWTRSIHWHHTIPRSLGGEDMLQIPIDGDCHTKLHGKADAAHSYLKGNRKKPPGPYWDNSEHEAAAEPWLQILIQAMLDPPIEDDAKQVLLPSLKVDLDKRFRLDLLKRDLPGVTNLTQTLLYCVLYTLENKGYNNDKSSTTSDPGTKSSRNQNRRTDLW